MNHLYSWASLEVLVLTHICAYLLGVATPVALFIVVMYGGSTEDPYGEAEPGKSGDMIDHRQAD